MRPTLPPPTDARLQTACVMICGWVVGANTVVDGGYTKQVGF